MDCSILVFSTCFVELCFPVFKKVLGSSLVWFYYIKNQEPWIRASIPSKLRMHAACMLHACFMHENVFACMQACMHSKLHAC